LRVRGESSPSMSTYYASGSADAFLAERGFDDKWVHKEERKKDIWEEVKTGKKKQLSGAEKRARAAKISEQVLKNADSVRVDVDGQEMNRLLEKQARKEGMGEKGQEPKQPSAKPKKEKPAPAAPPPKKEAPVPFVTSVPLTARRVRTELSTFMAKYENTYAQVIALSEMLHEAFEPLRIDLIWEQHVDVLAAPSSWLDKPASLLPEDTISAIVEWLEGIPQKHLAELCEFLVEHGMPGGGKMGRGGDKEYLGLKALLQIMLQRVRGAGANPGMHATRAPQILQKSAVRLMSDLLTYAHLRLLVRGRERAGKHRGSRRPPHLVCGSAVCDVDDSAACSTKCACLASELFPLPAASARARPQLQREVGSAVCCCVKPPARVS
jgi:hypothetical protein